MLDSTAGDASAVVEDATVVESTVIEEGPLHSHITSLVTHLVTSIGVSNALLA